MNVVLYSDYADSVRYVLTSQPRRGDEVEIVLDLFRGAAPLSQTTLARVGRREAPQVLLRCRSHLERQGLRAATHAPQPKPVPVEDRSDPRHSLPVAAFDWMFEAG